MKKMVCKRKTCRRRRKYKTAELVGGGWDELWRAFVEWWRQENNTEDGIPPKSLWEQVVDFFRGDEGQCPVPDLPQCSPNDAPRPSLPSILRPAKLRGKVLSNPFMREIGYESGSFTRSDRPQEKGEFEQFQAEQPDPQTDIEDKIIDTNSAVIRFTGWLARLFGRSSERIVRHAAADTLKEGLKTAAAAPATTFTVLAVKDPLGAANLAVSTVDLAVKAALGFAKSATALISLGMFLYSWLSPTQRRNRRIAEYADSLKNAPIRAYAKRVTDEAAELEKMKKSSSDGAIVSYELSTYCIWMIKYFSAPVEDVAADQALLEMRDVCQRLDGDLEAKMYRVALLQVLLCNPHKEDGFSNFNSIAKEIGYDEAEIKRLWKVWKQRGYERALALQNVVYEDVTKRTEYERSATHNSQLLQAMHDRLKRDRGDDDDDDDDDDDPEDVAERKRRKRRRKDDNGSDKTS